MKMATFALTLSRHLGRNPVSEIRRISVLPVLTPFDNAAYHLSRVPIYSICHSSICHSRSFGSLSSFLHDLAITTSIINGASNRSLSTSHSYFANEKTRNKKNLDPYHYLAAPAIIPTFHFQRSLPRLPVPDLSVTIDRYLAAQRPLHADDDAGDAAFAATEAISRAFVENEGAVLQRELLRRNAAAPHTSYISGWWFDAYLRDRAPLPLNYNPFIGFTDDDIVENDGKHEANDNDENTNSGSRDAQLLRAVNFLVSSARFYNSLTTETLDPEMYHLNRSKSDNLTIRRILKYIPSFVSFYGAYLFKIFPLDMSQYGHLFHSTRVPQIGKDVLVKHPAPRHVVVLRRGHFYSLTILEKDGRIVDPMKLMAALKAIIEDPRPVVEYPVAAFTTTHRDRWATLRSVLLHSSVDEGAEVPNEVNAKSLYLIDSALFHLCLDDAAPSGVDDRTERLSLSDIFLHGVEGVNRWFDKCFSLIVCANGKAGVNFEHAWGDGVAVLRYFNEIFDDSTKRPAVSEKDLINGVDSSSADFKKLEFHLSDHLKSESHRIQSEFLQTVSTLKTDLFIYYGVGRDDIKALKLSPDAVFQLAFQMAYYRMTGGEIDATYESCSTAAFKHGRTETVRPATKEVKDCCLAFGIDDNVDGKDAEMLLNLIREASAKHGQLTKEAAMGQGFDRHLFALKKIAEERGAEGLSSSSSLSSNSTLPVFFLDESYSKMNRNVLSTSTLGYIGAKIGGFAPTCEEGFGIGYMLMGDSLGCNVTSYQGNSDVEKYLECLRMSMDDILFVLRKGRS